MAYLLQRQNKESSTPTSLHNNSNKFGVYCTKGTVPGNPRNPNVIIALVILHRLTKHMTEFTLSYHSSDHF